MNGYGADRFLYPIQRDDLGSWTFNWVHNGTPHNTPITGPVYLYDDANVSSDIASDYPSLLRIISDDVLSTSGVTLEWSWGTPAGYSAADGLAFDADDATFGIDVGAGIDFFRSVIGYPGGATTIFANPGTPVVSPRSTIGQWLPRTLTGYEAQDKRSMSTAETYSSTDDPYDVTQYTTMRQREIRRMNYEWIPGLRIDGGEVRGESVAYRELADVSTSLGSYGDDGDALSLKEMWRILRFGKDCIIIQEVGDTVIAPTDEQIDIGPLATSAQRSDFSNLVTDLRAGGELYSVDMTFYLKHKGWDY